MDLNNIKNKTSWNDAAQSLNSNFSSLDIEIEKLKNATTRDKGYYSTYESLTAQHPTSTVGSRAFVGYTAPYAVYIWDNTTSSWVDTGETITTEPSPNLGDYYTKDETDAKLADKADLEEGKILMEQMPEGVLQGIFLTVAEYEELENSGRIDHSKLYYLIEE